MNTLYKTGDFISDPTSHKDRWEVYDIKQGGMGWVYALNINPRNVKARDFKCIILVFLNRNHEAIECYNMVLQTESKKSQVWYNKGVALGNLGYLPKALECFQKAKELGASQAEQAIVHCQQLIQQQEKS